MDTSTSDLQSLTARVEKLEKQYRLRSEVVTENLVLTDADGKRRATLCMSADGPMISLFDANGEQRLTLWVGGDGPVIVFRDENGKERLALLVDGSGPSLRMRNTNEMACAVVTTLEDGPSVALIDPANSDGNTSVQLMVDSDGPRLLCIKDGKVLWSAPVDTLDKLATAPSSIPPA